MKKEKSCGAVIYKIENNEIYYLILHMGFGHYSHCKGHVEKDETEIETAIREIKEETSLDVILDTNFRETITYSPFPDIIKDVVFFVGKIINPDQKPIDNHDDEVIEILFLKYQDAYNTLTYQNDKNILEKANNYIKSNN